MRSGDKVKSYDPWARNPSYAGGDGELTWEFASMRNHYHPSVKKFADDIAAKSKEVGLFFETARNQILRRN